MKLKHYFKLFSALLLWIIVHNFGFAETIVSKQQPKTRAPLFNNLSNYNHYITTNSPLSQRYFNQGLILFYGFDSGESIRSFKEAVRLDPECAMCYWGLALSLGSKNNMPMNGHEKQDAEAALKKAQLLVNPRNIAETSYISALSQRYVSNMITAKNTSYTFCHGASLATKAEAQNYATAMYQLTQQFPQDLDAKDLYAFALFDVNQWHFWQRDGKPYPNTPNIVKTLQSIFSSGASIGKC